MKSLVALALAGLVVFQLARTHQDVQKQTIIQEHAVVPAMTRTEVQQSLGTPSATTRDASGLETWTYTNNTNSTVTYVVFARDGVLSTRREVLLPIRPAVMAEARRVEVPHAVVPGVTNVGAAPFRSVGSRLDLAPHSVGPEIVSRAGRAAAPDYSAGSRSAAPVVEQPVHRVSGGVVVEPILHH